MHALGPPQNGEGASDGASFQTDSTGHNAAAIMAPIKGFHGALAYAAWDREARRLLDLFEKTGHIKTFIALSRHVQAMRMRGGGQ